MNYTKMKFFFHVFPPVLFAIILLNCNSDKKKERDKLYNDTSTSIGKKGDQIDTIKQEITFAGRPISFYLNHEQIPQIAKDLYNTNARPVDDKKTLALMDSIFTRNIETEPFYFLVLTKTMDKADGAYSEPLGTMAKKYVETQPQKFLAYFLNEPLLTSNNFNRWARSVAGEIMITAEKHEKEEAENVKKLMSNNCQNCTHKEKQKLNEFITSVQSYIQNPR